MISFRFLFLLAISVGLPGISVAQRLKGHISDPRCLGKPIILAYARGASFRSMDSVVVGPTGDFSFPQTFKATGFYRLSLNDTSVFDLILEANEPLVELNFDSLPLDEHVHVIASQENMRLWEFKYVSRQIQAVQTAVGQQRLSLQPTDTAALDELGKVEQRAIQTKEDHLEQLMDRAPGSFFAKVLRTDKAVLAARGKGPMAIAAVFNFSDPELMRSSVYDKAVMGFMQNLNVVDEEQFSVASDTLMALAAHDPDCKAYMLDHLIDLFSTYGPESALQHVIDFYVVPFGDSSVIAPELRAKVDALMQVSVGRTAPDILLNDRGTITALSKLVEANRYTALFFYSSTCDHCHAQMPSLKIDRRKYLPKGFNVIGIALDVDSADFLRSIEENAIPWKCYSEFNGWGATSAKTYQVKATPTFYLLDGNMKIVAKPGDADELGSRLKNLYQ